MWTKDEAMNQKGKAEIACIRAKIAKQHQAVDRLIAAYRQKYGDIAIVLFHEQPEVERCLWRGVMIAPYTGAGNKVRVSYFDANGFSGHTVYNTEHEAINDGYHDWTPDPDRLDRLVATDQQFQRGCAYVLALENLRVRLRQAPSDEQWQAEVRLRSEFYPN
jgi:hypothetical protein